MAEQGAGYLGHVNCKMKTRNVPLRLWVSCCKWAFAIKAFTSSKSCALKEVVLGCTLYFSSLTKFDFSEPVWYFDAEDFPEPKRHIGHWLGEATHIGQDMCYYISSIFRGTHG